MMKFFWGKIQKRGNLQANDSQKDESEELKIW